MAPRRQGFDVGDAVIPCRHFDLEQATFGNLTSVRRDHENERYRGVRSGASLTPDSGRLRTESCGDVRFRATKCQPTF